MKKILLFCFSFQVMLLDAQINFIELVPGPGFPDARNGNIAKGDIDNDGDLDVVITGLNGGQFKSALYTNDGAGNFTEVPGTPFKGLQFGESEFADIDNDGDLDLLMTGSNGQPQSFADLYANDGNGNFTLVSNTPLQASSEGDIVFEDIDNDSDLDLMMVGYDNDGDGFTKLYGNDGSGAFTELFTSTFEPAKGGSIAFIDFDLDDDQDVIVSGENNSGGILTTLYENNGEGVFSSVMNTPFPGVVFGDIGIADTDEDGDLDILLNGNMGGSNNFTRMYLNDGTGDFSELPTPDFPQTSLSDAKFADFDNDGDMDILITGSVIGAQFAAHIFENRGSNNFVFADTLNPMYLTSTVIADFDGDSDLDVIMVGIQNSSTAFKTRMFMNEGTISGVSDDRFRQEITIFPNPSSHVAMINSGDRQIKRLSIYNLMGGLLFQKELNANKYILDIRQFPAGTYVMSILDQNFNHALLKFIVE